MPPGESTFDSAAPLRSEITFRGELKQLKTLAEFTHNFCSTAAFTSAQTLALDLSLTEWVTNVISHGLKGTTGTIFVSLQLSGGVLEVVVEDTGPAFNPSLQQSVDTAVPLSDKPMGGLGIHLMQQLMDRMDYECRNGRNVVRLTKKIVR
jgi:anti-sigma regulatory factor (Ser/Thr protein kinase)